VTSPIRNFVLFQTDLFLLQQGEKDIDRWFVGGDCAGWFYIRLLTFDRFTQHREPIMEDWGWTFAVLADDVPIWVNVWAYFPIDNCWLFGVAAKRRILSGTTQVQIQNAHNAVCDALGSIIESDSRMEKNQWFTENPFDLLVRDF
jgi:hypothetical protein